MNARRNFFLERLINFYPPFLGAGIHSKNIDKETVRVSLKLTPFNRNAVGTHFGGSLYAMCDPWFMLILMRNLGSDYIVWDEAATIRFIQPGQGKVTATFHVPAERINEIRRAADLGQKMEPSFEVDIHDEQERVIAHVEMQLYVRKKR
jgi:acyl-coenzyme A thioesterase PaaI-like protein